jgi:large subunit ribosomal protein L1
VLGPRGLMPNPRSGTVTPDIGRAIREIKGGRVEFRVDRTGVIHAPIGKVSFDEDKILQNLSALVDAVVRAKPTGAKGTYLRTFNIAATMGPSIELDNAATLALASSET